MELLGDVNEVVVSEALVAAEVEAVPTDVLGRRERARLVAEEGEGAVLGRQAAEGRLRLDRLGFEERVEGVAVVLLVLQDGREGGRRGGLVTLLLQEPAEGIEV